MESGQELWDGGLEREWKIRKKVGRRKGENSYTASPIFFL